MRAFTAYPKNEVALRRVLRKLQDIGTINCDFETFNMLFLAWHEKVFPRATWKKYTPNTPYVADPNTSLLFREDWFRDFVTYLSAATVAADGTVTVLTSTGEAVLNTNFKGGSDDKT